MASTELLKAVAKLVRDPWERQRFNTSPAAWITEANLSKDEAAALLTMDPAVVAPAVKDQVDSFKFPNEEFPPISEEYRSELGDVEPEYPKPKPHVYRVRPLKIDTGGAGLDSFELLVTGRSFSPDAKLILTRAADNKKLTVSEELFGTFRCSRLRAVVGPVKNENTIKPDTYSVSVVINPGHASHERTINASKSLVIK